MDFQFLKVFHIINNVLEQNWEEILVNICDRQKVDTRPKTECCWMMCPLLSVSVCPLALGLLCMVASNSVGVPDVIFGRRVLENNGVTRVGPAEWDQCLCMRRQRTWSLFCVWLYREQHLVHLGLGPDACCLSFWVCSSLSQDKIVFLGQVSLLSLLAEQVCVYKLAVLCIFHVLVYIACRVMTRDICHGFFISL